MEDKIEGGSGPALAAHSKDGSGKGPTPASSKTDSDPGVAANSASETLNWASGQARHGAGQAAASASAATARTGQRLSDQGARVADQVAQFVREQPLMALVTTGAVCLLVGVLLGRR
jgi:ElaB/YqjD/DUF883 family membrane-anchored ribosome-binding protein